MNTNTNNKPQEITLYPYQVDHLDKLKTILERWYVAQDSSGTGAGKTYVALTLAKMYGYDVVLVSPPSLFSHWKNSADTMGVKILASISYHGLRGAAGRDFNHGDNSLLVRDLHDNVYASPEFKELLDRKILLVFDECHAVKNMVTKSLASAHALIRELVTRPRTLSRALLLSATPADKEEHAVSIVKMLGLSWDPELYTYSKTTGFVPTGFQTLYNFCMTVNPDITRATVPGGAPMINARNMSHIVFTLYTKVVKDFLSSAMIQVENELSEKILLNGFYSMPVADDKILRDAYDCLAHSVRFNDASRNVTFNKEGFGAITRCMILFEHAKLRTILRVALDILNEDIHNKVIIYLNYRKSIEGARTVLEKFKPIVLDGRTKMSDRQRFVDLFQRPTSEYRVVISHPRVGGVGLNLDDRDGRYPRSQLFSPSYEFIVLHQAAGRTHRVTTKSVSRNIMVFSKRVPEELSIIDALSRKAVSLRGYRPNTAVDKKGIYPGEYPRYVEATDNGEVPFRLDLDNADDVEALSEDEIEEPEIDAEE
jgi:hypothetical protein